jgi:hypothetical protein
VSFENIAVAGVLSVDCNLRYHREVPCYTLSSSSGRAGEDDEKEIQPMAFRPDDNETDERQKSEQKQAKAEREQLKKDRDAQKDKVRKDQIAQSKKS